MGIAQAYNDADTGMLWVRTCAGAPSRRGAPTTWQVTNLPNPAAVRVTCDGEDFAAVRVIGKDAIEITCDMHDHLFRLSVGTEGEQAVAEKRRARLGDVSSPDVTATPRAQPSAAGGISGHWPPRPQAALAVGPPSGGVARDLTRAGQRRALSLPHLHPALPSPLITRRLIVVRTARPPPADGGAGRSPSRLTRGGGTNPRPISSTGVSSAAWRQRIVGTLTERLRELERHQAGRRELLPGQRAGARYSLTPSGHALARLLCELEEWGAKTLPAPMIVSPAAESRTFRSAAHTP